MGFNLNCSPVVRMPSVITDTQAVGANFILTGSGTAPAYAHRQSMPAAMKLIAGLGGAARARFRFLHPANPGTTQTVQAVLLRPSPAAATGIRAASGSGLIEVVPLCSFTLTYGAAGLGVDSDISASADRQAAISALSLDADASAFLTLVGGGSIDVVGSRELVLGSFIRGSYVAFDAKQGSGSGGLAMLYETYEY